MDTAPCNKFSLVVRQPPHQQPATDVWAPHRLLRDVLLAQLYEASSRPRDSRDNGSGSHPTPPSNSHQL
ncbi:hypothetical protein BDZ89DRAFT_1079919 [Hymenopellis radicata]|nr:hypothetical protein BDZ89DRAFT_1079919 [Hymenopellis radicata]